MKSALLLLAALVVVGCDNRSQSAGRIGFAMVASGSPKLEIDLDPSLPDHIRQGSIKSDLTGEHVNFRWRQVDGGVEVTAMAKDRTVTETIAIPELDMQTEVVDGILKVFIWPEHLAVARRP